MPPQHNIQTYSNIEYSNSECIITIDGQKIRTNIETALFWGMVSMVESGVKINVRHNWYIHYLLEKIPNYSIEIGSNDDRLQWLINCLSASLKSRYHNIENDIEFLYGALWDYPEILEKDWKPRNVRISQLLKHFENKRNKEEKKEVWRAYQNKLLNILSEYEIKLNKDIQNYIEWKYTQRRSPKQYELETYWLSSEVAKLITKKWAFVIIESLLNNDHLNKNPIFMTENDWYELVELYTYQQLKNESKVTWHCAWDSKTYINKINTGNTKIYSLRTKWKKELGKNKNITIEYNIKTQKIVQIEGKAIINSHRTTKTHEINTALELLHKAEIEVSWFHSNIYKQVYHWSNVCFKKTENGSLKIARHYCVPKEYRKNIIWWKIRIDECDKWEDIKNYLELPDITFDATDMRKEYKNKITHIKCKNFIDDSKENLIYDSLEYIDGSFISKWNWASYVRAQNLKSCHYLECYYAERVEMDSLERIQWDLFCINAETINMENLEVIEWRLDVREDKVEMVTPKLKFVWGKPYTNK